MCSISYRPRADRSTVRTGTRRIVAAGLIALFLITATSAGAQAFPGLSLPANGGSSASSGTSNTRASASSEGSGAAASSGATRLPTAAANRGDMWSSFNEIFRENSVIDWVILLVILLAGLALGRTLAFLLRRGADGLKGRDKELRAALLASAAGPSNLALITAGVAFGLSRIVMDAAVRSFVNDVVSLLTYITIFWYLHNAIGDFEIVLRRVAARTETILDDMLVPLIRKTLRLFLIIVGVLLVAENVFRQNIATWLAGLGIAGIAVSLAAQDSLKNLFGSITILFDQPFKLGDRILFSGYDGPVEEIGFRSIKIRTLTGHLVTIPNSKVVNEAVENIGARPYIRRVMNVTITYDTPREKVSRAVEIIEALFEEDGIKEPIHGSVGSDQLPPKAYFSDFNADSLNIIVLYWFFPPAYWDYMDHAQRFNLRLMEEYEKEGIEFAFPTQTLYIAGDPKRPFSIEERPSAGSRRGAAGKERDGA